MGERVDHCSYPDGKVLLWGYPDRHVNHSCDPNAYEMFEAGASYLVARRYMEYRPLLASWFVSQYRDRIESLDAQRSGS